MIQSRWLFGVSATLLGLGGCGRTESTVVYTVRDSSSVRIVEYEGDPMRDPPRLRTSRVFRVGWEADEPTFESDVFPVPGQLRSGGRIAVADYNGKKLYRVQRDGAVSEVGRSGEGPGEYGWLDALVLEGDTIVLQDDLNRRLTWFAPDGTVETVRLEIASRSDHWVISSLHPGGFLTVPYSYDSRSPEGWLDRAIIVLDRSGRIADTVAVLPFHLIGAPGDENPMLSFFHAWPVGFPDGGFAYGRNDSPEIVWYDHEGSVRQRVRWQATMREATQEDREQYEEWYLSLRSPELTEASLARGLEARREDFGGPVPLFGPLHTSDDGSVWVEPLVFGGMPDYVDVFGADGTYVGRVELPERFTVIDVDGPFVLGWEFDRLDVPAIALYRVPSLEVE